jgi:hypothetical protein
MLRSALHRWSLILGILAMVSALVSVPASAASVFATMGTGTNTAQSTHHGMSTAATEAPMPCKGAMKHCLHCPQKICPELAGCAVKCFQAFSPLPAEARLMGEVLRERLPPGRAAVTAGSLIPPLLRPPSV